MAMRLGYNTRDEGSMRTHLYCNAPSVKVNGWIRPKTRGELVSRARKIVENTKVATKVIDVISDDEIEIDLNIPLFGDINEGD